MNLASKNLILAGVAVALAVPTVLQLRSEVDSFVDIARIPAMFDGFTSDNVGVIVLGQPKAEQPAPPPNANANQPRVAYDQLVLQRDADGEGWRIGQLAGQPAVALAGAPVMAPRVENDVFQHLRLIRNDPETLVQPSATEEQLVEYGLDDEHAFVVVARDRSGQNLVAELLVGNDAGGGAQGTESVRGVFVRRRGSTDVVLYEWQKPWRRDVEADRWIDRVLCRFEPDKIRRLSLQNTATGGATFVFEKAPNESRWQATAGADELGALRQGEIEALAQRFRYVAVQRYVRPMTRAGDLTALGLGPPQIVVELTVEDGGEPRSFRYEFGDRVDDNSKEFWMTGSDSPFLMTIGAPFVTQLELDVARRLFDPKGN